MAKIDDSVKKKVPELRFKGFTDEWEERKLGELASFSKGNGYTKNDLVEFGEPIILYGRLYTKYETVIEKVDTFVNKKDKSIISEGSEVIVPASGESSEDISRASVVGKSGLILGGDLNIIKPVNYIDSIFLALTISNGSQQKEMSKRAQGKSVVHLHNSDLKQVNLLYPKLEEQQKIGSFFKQLDITIALHQRKLDLLKEQKKGYLQKMFPKNGAKVPELRFAGFADDWEERKLKDVTERVRSNDGRMDLPTLTMSASSGWLDQKDRFSGDISGKEKKNYTLLKKGELSYNHGNSKLAKYGVVFSLTNYEEALVPRVYHSFKALENTSADFIEYMFSTKLPDRELGKLISSGARMDGLLNINYDDFMNIHISIPNYEEQILMSAFFRKLDENIALHQRKLDLLKEQKKGFLQKMFV